VTYTFGSATRARFSASLPASANRDAYLTFPTFLAAEQALVGVMNGHGPQGEHGYVVAAASIKHSLRLSSCLRPSIAKCEAVV